MATGARCSNAAGCLDPSWSAADRRSRQGAFPGNYRVVQQLSEGGMGMVYLGHHEALDRRVVIKVLQLELCDADAFEAQGRALFNKNKYEEALDAYDAAYKCRLAMTLLRDAFVVACNMRHKPEARSYWRQLSVEARAQSLGCR